MLASKDMKSVTFNYLYAWIQGYSCLNLEMAKYIKQNRIVPGKNSKLVYQLAQWNNKIK